MKTEKLKIIYEDKYFIAVYKKHGLLTVSTAKEKEKTLYHQVSEYVKKQHKSNKIFIIHRLDKDTSGIVLFAKNMFIKEKMQQNWDNVIREYICLVKGKTNAAGDIELMLKENKYNKMYISKDGKKSLTHYEVIDYYKDKTLLKVRILTGRKHQIRFSLNEINHPIIGDEIYDNNSSKTFLHLCANHLLFVHPITREKIDLNINVGKLIN